VEEEERGAGTRGDVVHPDAIDAGAVVDDGCAVVVVGFCEASGVGHCCEGGLAGVVFGGGEVDGQ
jgi:hypothetical protein